MRRKRPSSRIAGQLRPALSCCQRCSAYQGPIGLLGAWTHLSVHQLVDKLYVANLHLYIGALLGVLSVMLIWTMEFKNRDGQSS